MHTGYLATLRDVVQFTTWAAAAATSLAPRIPPQTAESQLRRDRRPWSRLLESLTGDTISRRPADATGHHVALRTVAGQRSPASPPVAVPAAIAGAGPRRRKTAPGRAVRRAASAFDPRTTSVEMSGAIAFSGSLCSLALGRSGAKASARAGPQPAAKLRTLRANRFERQTAKVWVAPIGSTGRCQPTNGESRRRHTDRHRLALAGVLHSAPDARVPG